MGNEIIERTYEVLEEKPYIPEPDRFQGREERNGYVLYNKAKDDFVRQKNGLIIYFTEHSGLELITEMFSGGAMGSAYTLAHADISIEDVDYIDIVSSPYSVYLLLEKDGLYERWGAYYEVDFTKTDRLINWIDDDSI